MRFNYLDTNKRIIAIMPTRLVLMCVVVANRFKVYTDQPPIVYPYLTLCGQSYTVSSKKVLSVTYRNLAQFPLVRKRKKNLNNRKNEPKVPVFPS